MFSPNKWIRTFSIVPGFLVIGFLLFESLIFSMYFIPSLEYTTLSQTLFHYIHFIIFLWIYIACWWSYLACVFTHPGPVTDEYLKDYQEQYGRSDLRYCNKCDQYKPPRCHHCSICRMCVVNMDHHCPWLCNCIGYQNKKYFVLFLFYAWIGCIDIVICTIRSFYLSPTKYSYYSIITYKPLSFLCGTIAGAFAFTLTFFGGFHVWMVLFDKTTIEMNSHFRELFHRSNSSSHRKTTVYENWCMVMDNQWYFWFIPVHGKDFKFHWTFLENEDIDDNHDHDYENHREEMIRLLSQVSTHEIPRV